MSASIRSRKHPVNPYAIALAAIALPSIALPALADAAADAGADLNDRGTEVTVKGERHGPYKADHTSSPKKTQALIDTPQTVAVISKEVLQDQNATTLIDALRNTPGITMQLGENGNTSAGDTFQLRGFSAQSSVFLDGVRDLGAVSRDVFNVEQVEVAKGPAGADIGRGASSGYINLVSKLPTLKGGHSATASVYSQGGARATADVNFRTGETSAFRLNIMAQDIDVAGRDHVNNTGYGIAPSFAIGLGTDTRFYVFAQALHQDNLPDGGISAIGYDGYFNSVPALSAGKRVNRENFYGSADDYEKVDAAMLTGKVEHNFAGGAVLTNTSRYGQNSMNRVLTGISAGSSGIDAINPADPSTWTMTRNRQRVDQDNKILINTTNVSLTTHTGTWEHDLAIGAEVSYESQFNRTYSTSAMGVTDIVPPSNLYTPNSDTALPMPRATGAYTDGNTVTVAAYAFDTIKLDEKWLLNAGLRLDNYATETDVAKAGTAPAYTPTVDHLKASGTLASWNLGVVYKPRHNGSLYIAYGNSLTPPGGNNFVLSASASSTSNSAFDPVEVGNLEVGTKWDLMSKKVSLTAAWYQTIAKNELTLADPLNPTSFLQVGERKVDGIELGLVGQITPGWQISAGVQTLHTEITGGTTGNNSEGAAARWSPKLTGTVWTTYKVTPKFTIGGGASYTGDQLRVVDPSVNLAQSPGLAKIPEYWVANAMASYDITSRVALQLNIYNLFDEDYIATLNNGGSRLTPGAPLSGTLTLNVRF
ncbi:hypothetical protein AEAC466_06905 [Asticcacaulis sp. AC466]|uniref:catecholate siderophore receptor Fiu n=1 Tax=Asticcacaulis sp. AC466 TaxID=1282362 RepID=UPI0003C40136|nr:catecholate siderophore receptor Fiu [Asticcacaulis sp. AC466]ESQ84779.1 hypothetical protein AEAC466_06905 [Asticcacaulis sp. AC466]